MRSVFKILPVFFLAAFLACEEDEDLGFTGVFNLFVFETVDTCDGILNDGTSRVEISGTTDDLQVRFGDDAILTGGLNNENRFQVSGDVDVDGDGVPDAFMEMTFEIQGRGRRLEIETARLTFEGTHPDAPDRTCVQEFQGTGQRPNLSPII